MILSLPSGRRWLKRRGTFVLPFLRLEMYMPLGSVSRVGRAILVIGAMVLAAGTSQRLGAQQPAAPSKPIPIRVADSTQVQVIRLRDGSSIVGRVTEIGADTVRFAAQSGTLAIARTDIVELREVEKASL